MGQCLYLDESGRRCRGEAEAGSWFCGGHSPEGGLGPPLADPALRRFFFRLAALFLLAVFLAPLLLQGYQYLLDLLN